MAVEDQNIELALAMIQRLIQQLSEIENTHIHQVLIDTQTSLEKHQLPTQQQVDLLTVLLSDFCN